MAVLEVVRGERTGSQFPIVADRTLVGRHPTCQIVLENGVVSRHHAQILESHGTYYIEDLRSRNGTYVNEERIDGRTEICDGDEIRLCDVVMTFLLHPSVRTRSPEEGTAAAPEPLPPPVSNSINLEESKIYSLSSGEADVQAFASSGTIRRVSSDSDHKSLIDPEVKLKAILEITQALGGELKLDTVLPKMLATLFNIFPQAEQGFVLLKDANSNKLRVKASRTREAEDADTVAVSMTVVRHAMQTREALLSQNVSDDSRFKKSVSLSRMRIRSMMCVPMVGQDKEAIGIIQIVTRQDSRGFNEEDLDLMTSLATQATMAVENARLHEEHIRRRELERDLEFATQVQLGFLPKSRPNLAGYTFADYYEAALSVGGDYFDYVTFPDGRLAMAIGDVAGKGMPAALLMARLYSSTRFQLLTQPTLEEAVVGLNREISGSGLGHRFITFLVMVIDPTVHEVTIVNAGHLCPLLRTATGEVRPVGRDQSSLPLGIVPDQTYSSLTIPFGRGETLIAFTDGITEAMNSDREIYGSERLMKLIGEESSSLTDLMEAIVEDAEGFAGEMSSRDDTCLIGVRRADA